MANVGDVVLRPNQYMRCPVMTRDVRVESVSMLSMSKKLPDGLSFENSIKSIFFKI